MSIQDRIEAARAGTNPHVIIHVPSEWAVLGDDQFLPGYSVLLADPVVKDLNALDVEGRGVFLQDMAILGDALLEVTGACRINYEILGNTDHALHVHVFPRYESEPEEFKKGPVWFYSRMQRGSWPFDTARDSELISKIAEAIKRRIGVPPGGARRRTDTR